MPPCYLIKRLFLAGSIVFLLCGCDRQTRYNIVTTIFTGVPPFDQYYSEKKTITPIIKQEPKETVFSHPLWESGQCRYCHNNYPKTPGAEKAATGNEITGSSEAKAPGLDLPSQKLCIKCHIDKTPRRAIRERLWLHNTVAKGNCLSCHAQHQSKHTAHLRWPPSEICTTCHEHNVENLPAACLAKLSPKEQLSGCLACHNAHMGTNRFLLSRDFRETKRAAAPVK